MANKRYVDHRDNVFKSYADNQVAQIKVTHLLLVSDPQTGILTMGGHKSDWSPHEPNRIWWRRRERGTNDTAGHRCHNKNDTVTARLLYRNNKRYVDNAVKNCKDQRVSVDTSSNLLRAGMSWPVIYICEAIE